MSGSSNRRRCNQPGSRRCGPRVRQACRRVARHGRNRGGGRCPRSSGHRLRLGRPQDRLETPPSSFSANPESGRSRRADAEHPGGALVVSPAAGQPLSAAGPSTAQPVREVDSGGGDIGWTGTSILEKDLLPPAVSSHWSSRSTWKPFLASILRQGIADPQAAPHPPPGADLRDAKRANGWRRSFRLTAFHQPGESHIGIREDSSIKS